jgi:hypothetical protein
MTLLEHLVKEPVKTKQDTLMEEYVEYPKDIKILTHRIMLEKFNEKYDSFSSDQKAILKEVVTSIDNTSKLRDYYNTKVEKIKKDIVSKISEIEDKVLIIKLQEVIKYANPISKTRRVSNDDIVNLLQYSELLNNL